MAPRTRLSCVTYCVIIFITLSFLLPVAQLNMLPGFSWAQPAKAETSSRAAGAQDYGSTPGQVNFYPNGYPPKPNVLYTFNLSFSPEWKMTAYDIQDYQNRIRDFNAKLYDGTDGQMAIEKIDLWDNKAHWDVADIRYYNSNGRAFTYRGGIDIDGGHMFLYRNDGGKVIQHEWGHYGLYLPDEYTDWAGPFCTCTQGSTYNTDEWCCKNNHNAASQYAEASSCWEQIGNAYPNVTVMNPPVSGPWDEPNVFFMWHDKYDLATRDANMSVQPPNLSAGDLAYINVTFTNYNYSIDGSQRFDLYDNDPALGGKLITTQSVNVRDQPSFVVPFQIYVNEGQNTFWVKGDPNNTITEIDENNNVAKGTVYVNHRPVISLAMPKMFSGFEDTPLVVDLTAYEMDLEDNNVSLIWNITSYDDTKITNLKANYANDEFTFTPLANWFGATTVGIKLTDTAGATAKGSIDLEFASVNDLPAVTDLIIDTHSALRGGTANLKMHATDVENPEVALRATIEVKVPDGEWTALQSSWSEAFITTIETRSDSPLGNYSVRGMVTDTNQGESDWLYLNETFWVLNNKPYIMGVIPTAGTLFRTESTKIQFTAQDIEDLPDKFIWEVMMLGPDGFWEPYNGTLNYALGYSELTFAPDITASLGTYHFRARATDKDGNSTDWLDDTDGIIVMNNLPLSDYIKADVKEVFRAQSVEVRAAGTDVEQGKSGIVPEFQYNFGQVWATEYLSAPFFDKSKGEWVTNFTAPIGAPLGPVNFQVRFKDADGELSDWIKTDPVQVRNNLPVCRMNGPSKGQTGEPLKFFGSNSSDIEGQVTYEWSFGDGITSAEANPWHKYTSARVYTVTLTVKDPNGVPDTKSITVTVTKKPEPSPPVTLPGTGKGSLIGTWLLLVIIVLIAALGFFGGIIYAVRKNRRPPQECPPSGPQASSSSLLYEEFEQPAKPSEGAPVPAGPPKADTGPAPPMEGPTETPKDQVVAPKTETPQPANNTTGPPPAGPAPKP